MATNNHCRLLLLCGWVAILGACAPAVVHQWEDISPQNGMAWSQVSEVLSGDSVRLYDGQVIKYLGIQAPQTGEPLFEQAREANAWLLRQHRAVIQIAPGVTTKEGYPCAYVFAIYSQVKGVFCFVNKELLQFGYAQAEHSTEHQYREEFARLEADAQRAKLGIWQSKP